MRTLLLKKFNYDIANYIYSIYINDYINYKLYGKMIHLETVTRSFIKKYNYTHVEKVYINDYLVINNILLSSNSVFNYYKIIKTCTIDKHFKLLFNNLKELLINTSHVIKKNTINELHTPTANYGIIISNKIDKIIEKF